MAPRTRPRAYPDPRAATVTGLLAWGQAGNYNAIDDRSALAALYLSGRGSGGLVSPPTFTAQSGLTFQIGPWLAVVDCGDGTRAVIGSRAAQNIDETAGGASARADVVWADISPDAATYTISLIPESAMAGRAGVFLGLVLVPASASTSAAMDLRPGGSRVLGMRKSFQPNITITNIAWRTWASIVIPAYDAEVGATYDLEVWGGGAQGNPRQELDVAAALNGTVMGSYLRFAFNSLPTTNDQFRLWTRIRAICMSTGTGGTFQTAVWANQSETSQPLATVNNNFASGFACDTASNVTPADTTRDITLAVQCQWSTGSGSGANIVSRQAIGGRVA